MVSGVLRKVLRFEVRLDLVNRKFLACVLVKGKRRGQIRMFTLV